MRSILICSLIVFGATIQLLFSQTNFDYNKAKKPELLAALIKQGFNSEDIAKAKRKDLSSLYQAILQINELDDNLKRSLDSSYMSYLDSSRYIYNFNEYSKVEAGIETEASVKRFRNESIKILSTVVKNTYSPVVNYNTGSDVFIDRLFASSKESIELNMLNISKFSNKLMEDLEATHFFLQKKSIEHQAKLDHERLEKMKLKEERMQREIAEIEKNRQDSIWKAEMLLKAKIESEEKNRKIDSLINSSPKKVTLYKQFFHTTSYAGITLDFMPIGFTPKKNKRTYDRVTLMGKTFTRGFVEHDQYGERSMEVRYHANGNPGIVKIYDDNNMIYYAEFSEHSSKPNEVSAFSKNYKYEIKFSNWNQDFKKRAFVYPDYKNTSHIYYELPD